MLQFLFLVQLSLQVWVGVIVSRRWGFRSAQVFLSVFTLIQANFIFTGYFLSIFSLMNHHLLFLGFSTGLTVLFYKISCKKSPIRIVDLQVEPWESDLYSRFARLVFFAVVVSSICFAGFLFYLAINTPLRVPDTVAVKMASSYFYLMNGNFLGHGSGGEIDQGRLFTTPFNVFSMWITLTRFGLPTNAINLYHFVSWVAMFISVYLLGREVSKSRVACWFAAFSFCGTLVLLMQGYLDFDDLAASVTATVGIYFFLQWLKDKKFRLLGLAAAGVGISFGAKMFPALYLPAVIAVCCWQVFRVGVERCLELLNGLKGQIVLGGAIFLCFTLPYPIVQFIETGHFSYASRVAATANWPFNVLIAVHNLMIYNLQLLFFSVPDLLRFENSGVERTWVVDFLNDTFLQLVPRPANVSWLPGTPSRIFYYEIINPDAWYGFLPLSVLLTLLLFLFSRRPIPRLALWSVFFFVGWDVFLSVRALYLDGMGRYWILPVSLIAPILTVGWEWKRTRPLIYFAVFTTAYFAWMAFFKVELTNGFLDLKAAKSLAQMQPIVSKPLREVLQAERDLHLVFNFEDLPLYHILSERRHLKVTTSREFEPRKLNIYMASENPIENWVVGDHSFVFPLEDHNPASFCALGPDSLSVRIPVFAWPSTWKGLDCGLGIYSIVFASATKVDRHRNVQDLDFWVLQNDNETVQIRVQFFDHQKNLLRGTPWSASSSRQRLHLIGIPFQEVSQMTLSLKYQGKFVATRVFEVRSK